MSSRPPIDPLFMGFASLMAARSTCLRGTVGAVIAQDRRPVAAGYVGSPPGQPHCLDVGCILGPDGGCIATIHAEANAISWAARQGVKTLGATLYTTMMPCRKCAQLILSAGIIRVYYHASYRELSGAQLLSASGVTVDYMPLPQEWNALQDRGPEDTKPVGETSQA